MRYVTVFILAVAAVVASATAGFTQGVDSGWLLEAEVTAGRQLYKDRCAVCHEQKLGSRFVLGPSLKGIVGLPAAAVAGFPYSNALRQSGLIWTEDNLRKWIADNEHMVPGMLMPHVEVKDPAEILYIVEYLKTLKAPAKP